MFSKKKHYITTKMKFHLSTKYKSSEKHHLKYKNNNLKACPTDYYKQNLTFIRNFAEYLAPKTGYSFKRLWKFFQPTVHYKLNYEFLFEHATDYLIQFCEQKRKTNKKPYIIQERCINQFEVWNIPFDSERVTAEISYTNSHRTDEQFEEDKSIQYMIYKPHVTQMIKWLGDVCIEDFKELLSQILSKRYSYVYDNVTRHKTEYRSLYAIDDAEVFAKLMLKVRAMLCLFTVTGVRGVALYRHKYGQFSPIDGAPGNYIISYQSGKGTRTNRQRHAHITAEANPLKTSFVRIVHNADPTIDAIAAYHHLIGVLSEEEREYPFHYGVSKYTQSGSEKQQRHVFEDIRRQTWCILTVAAFACMDEDHFKIHVNGAKKIHAWRYYCSTYLTESGAAGTEANLHLGWATTGTRERNYIHRLVLQKTNQACFYLANRIVKDGDTEFQHIPEPGIWQYLPDVNGDICALTVGANVAPNNFTLLKSYNLNPALEKTLRNARPKKQITMTEVESHIRQLNVQNQELMTKVSELEEKYPEEDPIAKVTELFKEHFTNNKEIQESVNLIDFIHYCKSTVNTHFRPILEAHQHQSKCLGIGLDTKTTIARYVVAICVFGALQPDESELLERIIVLKRKNPKKSWWLCYKNFTDFRQAVVDAVPVVPKTNITSWPSLAPYYS